MKGVWMCVRDDKGETKGNKAPVGESEMNSMDHNIRWILS